ncbi:PD-(D/E)XK nuclease family protein [Sinorhizobium psoraleae]|uniref:PD-(D/E)XK nuclease family protein n=1 Tax=Sinorhizobium psoraleae TaxID=520838 RepID=A0ABT4KQH5_9HYPH|nr:PD-(D/E)XK nuclease family protein [Sinorhizobium psoraleae]MCZ4093541.1 PD-(D/E)XK nuclease family protein [Sinorhizobium psoraleae]
MLETHSFHFRLSELLQRINALLPQERTIEATPPDEAKLRGLLSDLSPLITAFSAIGNADDIWSVVGLERNEVRTARVLTWLLDPRGSHGARATYFKTLWQNIPEQRRPFELGTVLRATRETVPIGDGQNRVDIEVEGDDFIVIIEVKIDAVEGLNQLSRYVSVAKAKATVRGKSKFAVLFLTPGRPLTLPQHCVHVSWLDISRAIKQTLKANPSESMGAHLASSFADHIRSL